MSRARELAAFTLALALLECRPAPPALVRPVESALPAPAATPRESFVPREPRLVPAEVLIHSYTAIFGDLLPPEIRKNYGAANAEGRYFGWEQHLSALGLPDYPRDLPRVTQTNTVMVAAFEGLAATLCDRAALHDLTPRLRDATLAPELAALVQVKAPPLFAFDAPPGPITIDAFRPRFDVLHRSFLGYPVDLAPPERVADFHALYTEVEARHRGGQKSSVPPPVAAWSAVCQGLARHPEFHHY